MPTRNPCSGVSYVQLPQIECVKVVVYKWCVNMTLSNQQRVTLVTFNAKQESYMVSERKESWRHLNSCCWYSFLLLKVPIQYWRHTYRYGPPLVHKITSTLFPPPQIHMYPCTCQMPSKRKQFITRGRLPGWAHKETVYSEKKIRSPSSCYKSFPRTIYQS